MKTEKSTQLAQQQQQQDQNRKPSVWTKEKINQLIELYKKHECLWNHWHESYKSKDKRNRAIQEICTSLRITKFDFGKKVHNLRNQFNTEMKKLEQRLEEAGASLDDDSVTASLRCKWSHFESLMFLRPVIEPRPGGYQNTFQASKKMRLKFDFGSGDEDINVTTVVPSNNGNVNKRSTTINAEEITQYQFEDNDTEEVITEDFTAFENEIAEAGHHTSREEIYDQKFQPPINQELTTRTFITSIGSQKKLPSSSQPTHILPQSSSSCQTDVISINDDSPAVLELNSNNLTVVASSPQIISSSSASTPVIASVSSGSSSNRPSSVLRDQWDAFGELVANEFRNLNNDVSRKRLKRKIMQAMLEVGEEDDSLVK